MFITRKEFEEHQENVFNGMTKRVDEINALIKKVDSLAKELGYEWTSEAVKETVDPLYYERTASGTKYFGGSEKAVLKWGWKKLNSKSK